MTDVATESTEISTLELNKKLEKLAKKIPDEVVAELDNMDEADLRRRIVRCQVHLAEIAASMEADDDLQKAKDVLTNAKAPYTEAKKSQATIASYATLRLKGILG